MTTKTAGPQVPARRITHELAEFAAHTDWDDLPTLAGEKVALHTLDIVGVAVAGSTKPWNALVRHYAVEESRPGPCSVIGSSERVRADWAALTNATAAHGIELDDYHVPAAVHAGCVVI